MQITTGKLAVPERTVIYGPEFVGKSTLASQFPKPLFMDTEGSTAQLDVARMPPPTSWGMVLSSIRALLRDTMGYQTLVIDTADWAEKLAVQEVCAELGVVALGDSKDWGHSFNVLAGKWSLFLDLLTELTEKQGMDVVLTAHSQVKKLEVPEEFGAFDRYQLKLEKKTAALTKEWATVLLFCNFRVLVIEDDKTKSKKGQGGQRTIFAHRHACWDAKNRHGLAPELPMDFSSIAHLYPDRGAPAPAPVLAPVPAQQAAQAPVHQTPQAPVLSDAHRKLADAMAGSGISPAQVQACIENHPKLGSIFPKGMLAENYPDDFILRTLLPAWDRVAEKAKEYTNV